MKIKAYKISLLKPGTHVVIHNTTYIKMRDSLPAHIEDAIFNPVSGDWCSWPQLVLWDDEVEIQEELT